MSPAAQLRISGRSARGPQGYEGPIAQTRPFAPHRPDVGHSEIKQFPLILENANTGQNRSAMRHANPLCGMKSRIATSRPLHCGCLISVDETWQDAVVVHSARIGSEHVARRSAGAELPVHLALDVLVPQIYRPTADEKS